MKNNLIIIFSLLLLELSSKGQVKDSIPLKQPAPGNILLNGVKFDTLFVNEMVLLFDAFRDVTFKRSDIYFSGTGFPNVVVVSVAGKLSPGDLKLFFEKMGPGSKLTFARGSLITGAGKVIAPFNKAIYFK